MGMLLERIFGDYLWQDYLAVEFFGLMGFALMNWITFLRREDKSRQFCPWYWFRQIDNVGWVIALMITLYFGLRFQIDLAGRIMTFIGMDAETVSDKYFIFPVLGFCYKLIVHLLMKLFKKKSE